MNDHVESGTDLDDRMDALVGEFSDAIATGRRPEHAEYLRRVPERARPGLERVLKMIDAGLSSAPATNTPLLPGAHIEHYELVREIGRGGMATVWLAQDQKLQRPVALKVMRPSLAVEPRHVERFRREALAIASLEHPHVVRIFGVGEDRERHYLAMEYVEGPSLATVLQALPTDRDPTAEDLARATGIAKLAGHDSYENAIANLLAPVAEALASAHERGIVHRDVKPSNILLRGDGRAVLADFGLAKGGEDPALSLTGESIGTPYYMSPEQAYLTGKTVDHRTDVYSLGVTLYEALAGVRPFGGDSFLEVVEAIRSTLPPALRHVRRECSRDAEALVRKAMARLPEDRYPTAATLCRDLQALATGQMTTARQEQGGPLRRAWAQIRLATRGELLEYRSARTLFGLPLIHIYTGRRPSGARPRRARAWFAVGDVATGFVAAGGRSAGVFAAGGLTAGVFSFGGIGVGIVTWAGIGIGALTFAGIALGRAAFGGIAVGHVAAGGIPIGTYVVGGLPYGTHVLNGAVPDPVAEAFFEQTFETLTGFLRLFGF